MCGNGVLKRATKEGPEDHVTERHAGRANRQTPKPQGEAPEPEDAHGEGAGKDEPFEQPRRIPGQYGYFPEYWPPLDF